VGKNPSLAYSTEALTDSCKQAHHFYMGSSATLPATGPHGEHKLRLNQVAELFLDVNGKIPAGKLMPEGSMIIKDTYEGSTLTIYSFMYKKSGAWLWGEVKTNGEIIHGVEASAAVCTACHSGSGNEDMILSFK
jgi:hypothetical protein